MGKGSSSAPDPDPNIGRAALKQAETGEQWLAFSKESFAVSQERQKELDALTKRVTEQQLGIADQQAAWAKSDRERYENTFKPIEDQFIQEATNYATPEKQAEAAATASADVRAAQASAKEQGLRDSASLGINPTSGRYAGIDRATDMAYSLADAGAKNNARQVVRDKGLALKADVANLGRGLPAQSAQAQSLGLGASGGALGLNQGTNAQSMQASNIVNSGYAGAMQGYAGMGQTLNQQYATQVSAWEAQNKANSGLFGGIGEALGGIAGMFMSDENVKENKVPVEDGKALEAIEKMPIEEWDYKEGVEDEGRHIGTYAQDFQKATGKGDGKSIPIIDAVGITMKAVQDVSKKVDGLAKQIGIAGAKKPKAVAPKARPRNMELGLGVAA
ncbi:tail fiber domain-containing protein [Brucella sp. 21LCYQ03]|nr:tail fiber domain-containing protein [Brucella sp. 21LCYQ03]